MSELSAARQEASVLRREVRDLQENVRATASQRERVAANLRDMQRGFRRDQEAMSRRQRDVEAAVAEQASRVADVDRHTQELRGELREERRRTAREMRALRAETQRRFEQAERDLRELDARLTRELQELRERQEAWFEEVRQANLRRGAHADALLTLAAEIAASDDPAGEAALGIGLLEATVSFGVSAARELLAAEESEAALAVASNAVGNAFHLIRERHRRRHALVAQRDAFLRRCDAAAASLEAPATRRFLTVETAHLRAHLRMVRAQVESGFREYAWLAAETRDGEQALRFVEPLVARVEQLGEDCEAWELQRVQRLETLLELLAGAFGQAATDCSDWRISADDPKADWMVRFVAPGQTIRLRVPLQRGMIFEEIGWSPSHARVEALLQDEFGSGEIWRADAPAAPRPGFHSTLLDTLIANAHPTHT